MSKIQGQEFYISKLVGKAMTEYGMLSEGDKIAVAVSGGKDSLTLLKVLQDRRSFVPVKYDLVAVHVDLGYPKSCAAPLARYFRKIGVEYHIEKTNEIRKTKPKDINCFWCSWNRRKALFASAHALGCRKVALGHHKDDIVETILMNMFFNGEISAMMPKQELFRGAIHVIRPLAYVEEDMIRRFVRKEGLKTFDCLCPHSVINNRARMGRIIRSLSRVCPDVKTNIYRSLSRIKKDYLL